MVQHAEKKCELIPKTDEEEDSTTKEAMLSQT